MADAAFAVRTACAVGLHAQNWGEWRAAVCQTCGNLPYRHSCPSALCVQVLSAMTQAAMLHVRGPLVSQDRIARALQTLQASMDATLVCPQCRYACSLRAAPELSSAIPLMHLVILPPHCRLSYMQSSSPSYVLMASLDAARAMITQPGFLVEAQEAAQVCSSWGETAAQGG